MKYQDVTLTFVTVICMLLSCTSALWAQTNEEGTFGKNFEIEMIEPEPFTLGLGGVNACNCSFTETRYDFDSEGNCILSYCSTFKEFPNQNGIYEPNNCTRVRGNWGLKRTNTVDPMLCVQKLIEDWLELIEDSL